MPRLAALAGGLKNPGTEQSQVMSVPFGMGQGILRLPRSNWPTRHADGRPGEVVQAEVEVSLDGGQTFPLKYGVGSHGGDYFNRRGDLVVETTLKFDLPEPNNLGRKVRVTLHRHATLDTRADLDIELLVTRGGV